MNNFFELLKSNQYFLYMRQRFFKIFWNQIVKKNTV